MIMKVKNGQRLDKDFDLSEGYKGAVKAYSAVVMTYSRSDFNTTGKLM